VIKKKTFKDYLISFGIVLAGIIITLAVGFIEFLVPFWFIIAAAVVYFMYQFITLLNIEYEYIVTNGDLDIDKIINRKRRKRIFSANCKDFEILARLKGGLNDRRIQNINNRIFAVSSMDAENVFFAILIYKGERTVVFFEPNEKMLNSFKLFIPRKIEA
jgi:hypothetical protein